MIHTVLLRKFLTKEVWDTIRCDETYEFRYQKKMGFVSRKYVDIGINRVVLHEFSGERLLYWIDLDINLHLLLDSDVLSDEERVYYRNMPLQVDLLKKEIIDSIYDRLFELFPQLDDYSMHPQSVEEKKSTAQRIVERHKANLSAFQLAEIDYVYDVPTPYVKTYLKLLNYGHQPGRIKRIRHEHEDGVDNLYEKNYSIKINFYDKEREQRERFGDEHVDQNCKVLRIEVALKRRKLYNAVRSEKHPDISQRTLYDFADIDYGYEIINYYLHQRCYRGDYYDLNTALKCIDYNNLLKPGMKEKLKKDVRSIKEYQGVDSYISHAESKGKKETIRKHLRILEDCNINPVTISRREKNAVQLHDGGYWLPSLFTIIDLRFKIEKNGMKDYLQEIARSAYGFDEDDYEMLEADFND